MNKLKYLSLIVAAVIAMPMYADDTDNDTEDEKPDYVYVPNVVLNEDGTGTVEVWLNTYVEEYNSFMMDIYLPEGFTIEQKRGKYLFTFNTEDDTIYDHTAVSALKEDADGKSYVRMIGSSITQSWIASGNHKIFSFNITGPENYDTTEDGKLTNLDFAEGNKIETGGDHWLPDVSFAIMPHPVVTEVESIKLCNADEEAFYTSNGIRISGKPTVPGLYLRGDGTKVIIK